MPSPLRARPPTKVVVSVLEIYNEKLRDLTNTDLGATSHKLELREEKGNAVGSRGVCVV